MKNDYRYDDPDYIYTDPETVLLGIKFDSSYCE
jgi:hypothetical protein